MRRLGWLVLFAVGFGFVEAAVVVYLRELAQPAGFAFPVAPLPARLVGVEVAREAATLAVLLGAACLAGRGFWARFAAFAVAFGVWDLVYYASLRLMIGWPLAWGTWDVLFLIPGIWTGPVSSAAAVAALLALCGAWIFHRAERGFMPQLRPYHVAAALLCLGSLLASFLWNHGLVLRGGVPEDFPWWLWGAGVAVGLAAFADLFLRPFRAR